MHAGRTAEVKRMERRRLLGSTLALAALPRIAKAQGASKVARVGWLTAQSAASLTPFLGAMRAALTELNLVEGQNLVIEYRYGDDAIERVPGFAAEFERMPVDLIIAQGAAVPILSTLGLKVPVVYVFSGDPIVAGFADDLAHPRGNMTGLTFMAAELNVKRLEILREAVPKLRDVAIVANPEHPGANIERQYCEEAGRTFGLALRYFPTSTRDQLDQAFTTLKSAPPQAISVFADGFAVANRRSILDFAMREQVPVISGWPIFATSGALCTYGPRLSDSYRRLAHYVDRILKGAKPADLPIERPTTFEFVLNLKTARSLNLALPSSLLVRADTVIE
jgi:putative tryptophan/tyrosine transport system substrate-binding protein